MAKIIELDEKQPQSKTKKNVSKVKQTRNKSEEIAGVSVIQRIVAVAVIITAYIYGRDYFLNRYILGEDFETFASVSEFISERSTFVPCSKDYGSEFKRCIPKKCGRFVMDSVVTKQEAINLRKLAEKGMSHGGGSGGATILDLHSGALSVGDKFVNIYSLTAKNNEPVFSKEDFELYKRVKEKIHFAVAHKFGIDPQVLYLTKPTFFSRMNSQPAVTLHDEYWHPHIDKVTYGSFFYTSLLYLSDSTKDFSGGRFVFIDKNVNITVEPRLGRLSFFTSGSENEHFVEKIEKGTRFAITVSFTCDKKFAISNPNGKLKS
ncbi:2-oxoglutarate and iron-dependent oxygenase domain-containing protein 3-like [Dendronephthya gigantea]|uniref:2-oxoglutarate and iron-dependent oxygenase domain-containing protein 3-like n=1 Tax=Dendronephthya gigantea TaxID=151771 RepID=UPI001069A65B|nr:2-oxoglutarate and iron-dependent oxygenase domain-containing protein 3-like [Dendronephthya gigantea]